MKSAEGWQDVAIQNVSAHGLKIAVALPPRRGAYIEIRRASQVIVARAVWVHDNECGLRTQDVVDVPALIDPNAARAEGMLADARRDRRVQPRVGESAARSRHFAARFQTVAIAVAIVLAAGIVLTTVSRTLGTPLDTISAALGGSDASRAQAQLSPSTD